jgi:hypothetical protein
MSESTKSAVLAKCGGMSYEEELENGWEYERRHYDGRSWHRLHKGCTTYDFDHRDADNDPCWQIAADILGIKQPEPIPPSDALLWECWKESANEKEWSARVRARESDRFKEWLATLPPDPLKADRELVVDFIIDGHLSFCLGNAGMPVDIMRKITSAIKRIAGMEMENG